MDGIVTQRMLEIDLAIAPWRIAVDRFPRVSLGTFAVSSGSKNLKTKELKLTKKAAKRTAKKRARIVYTKTDVRDLRAHSKS